MNGVRSVIVILLASWIHIGCNSMVAPVGGTDSGFVSSGEISIRWFLDMPRGTGPFPTVVYGAGSGDVSANHSSTIRFARMMNDLGYAVMRYDKRGTGKSDGEIPSVSTSNSKVTIGLLASDMTAVLDHVESDVRVDPNQIGLFGASQANWYMPAVADAKNIVSFMIIVTGGVLPVGFQNRFEELTRIEGRSKEEAESILGLLGDFQSDLGFSQIPILEQLDIPMLYLLGEDDSGFPQEANLVEMTKLSNGGANLTYILYPGGKHLLSGIDLKLDIEEWLKNNEL